MASSFEDLDLLAEVTARSYWAFRQIWNDVRVGPWVEISPADVASDKIEDLGHWVAECIEAPAQLERTGLGMEMFEDFTKRYQYVRLTELARFKRENGFV